MTVIDFDSPFGQRALQRLESEQVVWLVTVTASGQPKATPIWFLWQETDQSIVMYSQPDTMKLQNLRANPRIALHFNTDPHGNDVVRLEGMAEVARDIPPAIHVPAFMEKYGESIPTIPSTPEAFSAEYSVPIIFRPSRLTGF